MDVSEVPAFYFPEETMRSSVAREARIDLVFPLSLSLFRFFPVSRPVEGRGLHSFPVSFSSQVLSALDILQPPHLDFFQEMYPFLNTRTRLFRGVGRTFSRLRCRAQVNFLLSTIGYSNV